jgi:hypothetical protein
MDELPAVIVRIVLSSPGLSCVSGADNTIKKSDKSREAVEPRKQPR